MQLNNNSICILYLYYKLFNNAYLIILLLYCKLIIIYKRIFCYYLHNNSYELLYH